MTTFSDTKTSHVAVIPFPFSSHPSSAHRLVLRLARSSPNTHFTFLSIPEVNASLFGSSPPIANLTPYDLDYASQNTSGLNFQQKLDLFEKFLLRPGSIKTELNNAAGAAKITCLLVDAVLSFVLPDDLCLPWIALWTSASMLLSSFFHFHLIRHHCAAAGDADVALDFVPGLEGLRVSDHLQTQDMFHGELDEQPGFRQLAPKFEQALKRASAVVLSSFRELNPDELTRDLESKFKAFLNIGFFTVSFPLTQRSSEEDPTGCLAWLDGRKPNSVAYIGFGTWTMFSEDELRIMAEALEKTETSFLWSLPSEQQRLLPSGFAERTRDNGRLVVWTDQRRVLAHGSVGVNVSILQ